MELCSSGRHGGAEVSVSPYSKRGEKMMKKFWEERLERDVKNLKKSSWQVLSLIILKYGYEKEIRTRGLGAFDIALRITQNKTFFDKLNENEKMYVSGLLK